MVAIACCEQYSGIDRLDTISPLLRDIVQLRPDGNALCHYAATWARLEVNVGSLPTTTVRGALRCRACTVRTSASRNVSASLLRGCLDLVSLSCPTGGYYIREGLQLSRFIRHAGYNETDDWNPTNTPGAFRCSHFLIA